jgi:hypothetical protein
MKERSVGFLSEAMFLRPTFQAYSESEIIVE